MRNKVDMLKQQIHTAVDIFYDETGFLPFIEVETAEVSTKEFGGRTKTLASNIEILLK